MKPKTGIPTIATNGQNYFILGFRDNKNGELGDRHVAWCQWLANHTDERTVPAVEMRMDELRMSHEHRTGV